jgi:hypothetical protein
MDTIQNSVGISPPESPTAAFSRFAPKARTARVNGKILTFPNPEAAFNALVGEWRRLRESGSSVAPIMNDAYGQIVAMGWEVVPFLLREVQRQSGHWFDALTWITREDLVTPEMRGNIREQRKVWLSWGTRHGLIPPGYMSGSVVQGQLTATPRANM